MTLDDSEYIRLVRKANIGLVPYMQSADGTWTQITAACLSQLARSAYTAEAAERAAAARLEPVRPLPQSKTQRAAVHALELGYRVLPDGQVMGLRGKLLKLWPNQVTKYLSFSVVCDGRSFPLPVHRLAGLQLFGDTLTVGMQVRHLDGDRANNSHQNLAIGTPSDNAHDRPRAARVASVRKGLECKRLRKLAALVVA